jgi:hypothetical protein
MANDQPGLGLVAGDVAETPSIRADAARGHVRQPIAQEVGACLDAVGPVAAVCRGAGFQPDAKALHRDVLTAARGGKAKGRFLYVHQYSKINRLQVR